MSRYREDEERDEEDPGWRLEEEAMLRENATFTGRCAGCNRPQLTNKLCVECMEYDRVALCANCRAEPIRRNKRCNACSVYLHRNGVDRPVPGKWWRT